MHIKQISIQGFKSYRDQTVTEPFSPRFNCIVGKNGSGKSNFFSAIRFVLSDAYASMGKEERQALLHEGTGGQAMSAFVEIVFDNSDNRFPTGRSEVIIRRTIGLKKDEYSLDRKSVPKADIMNLLESAGFSKSNPYYIVPQGRVSWLTNAKDSERLQLLKEVAGTKVYEDRRQESLKIIEETEGKRLKIEESLEYLEEKLKELEQEKEELKEFQEFEKERKCLEYTIYGHELTDVDQQLKDFELTWQDMNTSSAQMRKEVSTLEMELEMLEESFKNAKHKNELGLDEKNRLDEEIQEWIKKKTQIELELDDLRQNKLTEDEARDNLLKALAEAETNIQKTLRRIDELVPLYANSKAKDLEMYNQMELLETQRNAFYAKQGRKVQFSSKAQRDKWIKEELRNIRKLIEKKEVDSRDLEKEVSLFDERFKEITQELDERRSGFEKRRKMAEELRQTYGSLRSTRDSLTDERKEMWRKEVELERESSEIKEQLARSERTLASMLDRGTIAGLEIVRRIMESGEISGVYGPLYELFEVDDRFKTAVETAAGSSLFHVVVDTDGTATKILDIINREKNGRITFMPLNRLRPTMNLEYPNSNDAIPMIRKLKFDNIYLRAFEQVFGKTLICKDLDVASDLAKSHGLNGITLDGDQVSKKGTLTGGYHDVRSSRLDIIKTIKLLREKFSTHAESLSRVQEALQTLDQQISHTFGELEKTDTRRKQLADTIEHFQMEIDSKTREQQGIRDAIQEKQKLLADWRSNSSTLQMQYDSLERELGTDLMSKLSVDDEKQLISLTRQIEQMKNVLVQLVKECTAIEQEKDACEIELNVNLHRVKREIENQLSALDEKIQSITIEQLQQNLSSSEKHIQRAENERQGEFIMYTCKLGSPVRHLLTGLSLLLSCFAFPRFITDLLVQLEELEKTLRNMEPLRDDLKVNVRLRMISSRIISLHGYALFPTSLPFMNHP